MNVFTGATGSTAGQYDVRGGGRLMVRGVYHERSSDALVGLQLADCGTLSIDATRFPADWLATPGIDCFGFYSSFSNFRAHRYEELAGKYRRMATQAHEAGQKMLLPVHPGHDNSRFRDDPYVMPRRDGRTLRDFLRAATDAGADFVMVTSWNEWPGTTVVEPSSSWPAPYHYLRILAEWNGKEFHVPPVPFEQPTAGGQAGHEEVVVCNRQRGPR